MLKSAIPFPASLTAAAGTVIAIAVGSVGGASPAIAAQRYEYDFETCAVTLQTLGLASDRVASSCAYILRPEELEACTVQLTEGTSATVEQAVDGCRRSRRPVELARCTTSIQALNPDTDVTPALDSCRRSLLPVRFADCVTGLQTAIAIDRDVALGQCLDGRDRPVDMYPAYPGARVVDP